MASTSGRFDAATFLRDYWQKKPLLIRKGEGLWPDGVWTNPLEPDELAGLACESDVESRLIVREGGQWQLEHGPLAEERFSRLGDAPWTLLVQAVDHQVPDVAALMASFRFIPNWRIDDVMVSYATDGAGVGPHFDQYDVFLVQGLGRRRWQVGGLCDDAARLVPHDDLRLLEDFHPTDEWVLEPGDVLYLPPRLAHDGVALGDDCMTYSIGFRAPARSELIAAWCDDVLAELCEDDRYGDPGLVPQDNPGEISASALAALQAMIAEKLADRVAFARTFGKHATTPRYPEADWRPEEPVGVAELEAELAKGAALLRNPASRFAFVESAGEGAPLLLFVDGQCHECSGEEADLARRLCASDRVEMDGELSAGALALLRGLVNQGSVAVGDAF